MNEYDQPLVSFVLLSYNQENFICDAIKSAFSQTYLPLEIIISDDCSEDSSFEKARALVETYEGPNKLRILRNSTRLGISDHINRVMTIVKGALIVIAAGDDLSRADRTQKIVSKWKSLGCPDISLHSGYYEMGLDGSVIREVIRKRNLCGSEDMINSDVITGATHAWSKNVFKIFGDLNINITHEDRVIGYRSSLLDGVFFLEEPLVFYRRGGVSDRRLTFSIDERMKNSRRYVYDLCQMFSDTITARKTEIVDQIKADRLLLLIARRLVRELDTTATSSSRIFFHVLFEIIFTKMRRMFRRHLVNRSPRE